MATLTIPEETKVIPEQKVDVDLYEELKKPLYFCPGIGGVNRDIRWIAEALERSKISFTPGELMRVITRMIQDDFVRLMGARDSTGEWYTAFTAVPHSSKQHQE